jgi:hypothetical protein
MSNPSMRCVWVAVLAATIAGCAEKEADEGFVRGPGLKVAPLPVPAKVAIYDAALKSAFDVGPGLTLLLDPRFLPRTTGLGAGAPVPKSLVTALRERGVVQGTCQSPGDEARQAALCDAANPGYIVRFSEIFRMKGDSVQLHVAVERYNTKTSAQSEVMRFEKAYQVVGQGTTWRVARQGRVTQATRGRGKAPGS